MLTSKLTLAEQQHRPAHFLVASRPHAVRSSWWKHLHHPALRPLHHLFHLRDSLHLRFFVLPLPWHEYPFRLIIGHYMQCFRIKQLRNTPSPSVAIHPPRPVEDGRREARLVFPTIGSKLFVRPRSRLLPTCHSPRYILPRSSKVTVSLQRPNGHPRTACHALLLRSPPLTHTRHQWHLHPLGDPREHAIHNLNNPLHRPPFPRDATIVTLGPQRRPPANPHRARRSPSHRKSSTTPISYAGAHAPRTKSEIKPRGENPQTWPTAATTSKRMTRRSAVSAATTTTRARPRWTTSRSKRKIPTTPSYSQASMYRTIFLGSTSNATSARSGSTARASAS